MYVEKIKKKVVLCVCAMPRLSRVLISNSNLAQLSNTACLFVAFFWLFQCEVTCCCSIFNTNKHTTIFQTQRCGPNGKPLGLSYTLHGYP